MGRRAALVIERREDLRRDVAALLGCCYEVETAARLEDGLELLRRQTFQLLIVGAGSSGDRLAPFARDRDGSEAMLLEILQMPERFGGRLVLLDDRDLNSGDAGTGTPVSRIQVMLAKLPFDPEVLNGGGGS